MTTINIPELFQFCPRCGRQGLAQETPVALRCAGCGYRHFINPVVAVAVIITDPQGRVLLIRRAKEPGKGLFGMPGGFVDLNETAEDAARREIREEVNLELNDLRYLTSFPNRYAYQGVAYPVLDLFFTARATSLAPLQALEDVDEIVFLPAREIVLAQMAFDSMRHAVRCFQETPAPDGMR